MLAADEGRLHRAPSQRVGEIQTAHDVASTHASRGVGAKHDLHAVRIRSYASHMRAPDGARRSSRAHDVGWRVAQILAAGKDYGLTLGTKQTHSYPVYRAPHFMALIAGHDGEKTEIEDREIRKFCRRLDIDPAEFMAKLRGA